MIAWEAIAGDIDGIRTVFVVPVIPDDAPTYVREALARRRLATVSGRCPCGARRPKLPRQARRTITRGGEPAPYHLWIEHEPECPAPDDRAVLDWNNERNRT